MCVIPAGRSTSGQSDRRKGGEAERAETTGALIAALTALTASTVISSCARIEPPPGGPPDASPPRLIATRPDSLTSLPSFRGPVEFHFDEVVSEGASPSRGEGTGTLEKLVLLSPSTRVPEVSWRRDRITVEPQEGWRPNRVYRIQLLPGVTDLRNNRSDEGTVVTFTTGAPRPRATLQGRVVDWSTSRPAPGALVVATLLPDSLPYRGLADSSGRFTLGPLPSGDYLVTGALDQNGDFRQDAREAYQTVRVPRGRSDAGELWAFVHDTTPPRIQTVTVDDSVSATVTFSQKLDPRQRLGPRDVRLRLLPDSLAVAVRSLLPKPVDDSLHQRTVPRDTTADADTLVRADTLRARRRIEPTREVMGDEQMLTGRPPLFDRLVLRVTRPWSPGARLVLEVRGIRNITGVAGNAVGVLAVPEKPKPAPGDTARAGPDTVRARKADRPQPPRPRQ